MVDGVSRLPHPLTGRLFSSPVPAGSGWPEDPSTAGSPVAEDAPSVRRLADVAADVAELSADVAVCRACPRLVAWREQVAREKRAAFIGQPYWGRPIAGWGAPDPRVLVVGLAPAAHGGNRTGRIFTGDRSGDWLFASLHRVGLAAKATSLYAGDGQSLLRTRMVAAVRCAPPANKPSPTERDACAPWFDAELALALASVRAVVCLGSFGWLCVWRSLARLGLPAPRPRPRFGHGVRVNVAVGASGGRQAVGAAAAGGRQVAVLGCYHPSQQNTFTGKLTEPMLDAVLATAAALADA